jgi:hypothetical protein
MKVEIEIAVGDVIKFNDEEWQVVNSPSHDNSFDMRSTVGNLENFTREEIEKQIDMTGKFARVKESYIGIS